MFVSVVAFTTKPIFFFCEVDMSMLLPVSKNVYGCAVATCVSAEQDKKKILCDAAAMLPKAVISSPLTTC